MIKPPMQFSLKQRRTQSVQQVIDQEAFGEMQTEKEFDQRLLQISEQVHQATQSSGLSSNRSKPGKHQTMESYAHLIQQMANSKELQVFCNQFGFSAKELEGLKTAEERENYVVNAMCKHIKLQLQNFMSKVELRQHQYRVEEWNDLQKVNKMNMNIFEWLDVKSKYQHLRKKLQYALIDAITQEKEQKEHKKNITSSNVSQLSRASTANCSTSRRRLSSIQESININPKVQLVQEYKGFKGVWTEDLEHQYRIKGKTSKVLGLYPVIQKAILDNVGQSVWNQQRDRLLTKYTEGGCLTADEVKFIATTSQLLNSCTDKVFLQKTIHFLDKNVIDQIENNIAECILDTFNNISKDVKTIRQEWLKKVSYNIEQQVKDTHFSVMKKMQIQKSQKELEKVKEKMITIFRDVQKKHLNRLQAELDKDQYLQSQKGVNRIILKFKDIMMKRVGHYRNEKNLGITRNFMNRNIPKNQTLLFKINKEMKSTEFIQRMFHPPSKVMVSQNGSKTERVSKEEHKYRVRSQSTIRQQEYKRFISGGPISERQYASTVLRESEQKVSNPSNPHQWITSEIEVAAINKIKAAIKAYIQRKNFKRQKTIKRSQNESQKSLLSRLTQKSPERIKMIEQEVINVIKKLTLNKQQSQSTIYSSKQRMQSDMRLKTRKLFLAVKKRSLNLAMQSGFHYTAEDANFQDEFGRTPLSYSAENGDDALCTYLIRLGANLNIPSNDGMTPMHYVFKSNELPLIIKFINLKGNLNKTNKDGLTPVAFCSQDVVRKLNLTHMISSALPEGKFDNHSILNRKYPQYSQIVEGLEFSGNYSRL